MLILSYNCTQELDKMENKRFRILTITGDILILIVSFAIVFLAIPGGFRTNLPDHGPVFVGMVVIWITVSLLNGKLLRGRILNINTLFLRTLESNFLTVAIAAIILLFLKRFEYSETIILGTSLIATIFELLTGWIFISFRKADFQNFDDNDEIRMFDTPTETELVNGTKTGVYNDYDIPAIDPEIISAIESECGKELAQAVLKLSGNHLGGTTAVLSTTTIFNIAGLPGNKYNYIINLHRINDIRKLDHFLDTVNRKLDKNGYFMCCVETKDQRKRRLLRKYPPVINWVFYTVDFLLKRIFPKLKLTSWLYMFLTRGENVVISRAEALGRLSRAGFRIKKESMIENLLCIEAKKKTEPLPQKENALSTLIALPRIGRGGQIIKVYKLRTMHPYSEYIQDYVYSLYDLREGGKFRNDFRITSWGAFCRKTWLDEFPMFFNILRGEMKLFGVRPLSRHYFELYRAEVKERRIKYKPGLIPPFYVDMPNNLNEIQASEMHYLDAYDKNPYLTDFIYFWKSLVNILFRKARSR
jgi:lipopolysaccharide/colanic/teichoic acid biosynthesis glycosyltransferase